MHIFFSGIGGAGVGPLALIAHQAGYTVSGSDKQESNYINYLREHGISNIQVGLQDASNINNDVDWIVYSSAVAIENPNHPELLYAKQHGIKCTKRDEFINYLLEDKNLKMIAIAGTHGKTTTTAMTVWTYLNLDMPVSYLIPAKTSFADMGHYEPGSSYFVYECDEYDKNFLKFKPELSIITGIDWDHPDIYPTREDYNAAFRGFISQSGGTVIFEDDFDTLGLQPANNILALKKDADRLKLAGEVNRNNAQLVLEALHEHTNISLNDLIEILNRFPGVSRRFEKIIEGVFTDYAHTPPKIAGALQLAHEVAGDNVVVVYEGLHNTRQHFIKKDLAHIFDSVKKLYVVPSYLAREDESLELLTPEDIINLTSQPNKGIPASLNDDLKNAIEHERANGNLVLCLTAGGGNSLDEWLRKNFI